MPRYELKTWSDPVLRQKCVPVDDFSKLNDLVHSMYSIMHYYSGAGIAAPQVGDNRRVLIAKLDYYSDSPSENVFVNPVIVKSSGYTLHNEGCLSFPEFRRYMLRRRFITVSYDDINGDKKIEKFSGLNSIILQHEMDHLDGKTIYKG